MNKIAIFVEGQTEELFAERLLLVMAGDSNIQIEKREARGGVSFKRRMRLVEVCGSISGHQFYAMIVNCGADERVGTDIHERYDGLVKTGFGWIVGMRDLYRGDVLPHVLRAKLPDVKMEFQKYLKTKPVQVQFVLAVMEVEAWFLAECTHFARISPALTIPHIKAAVGFDPCTDDMELRDHPSEDLDKIYRLAALPYDKKRGTVQLMIEALDFAEICLVLVNKFDSLRLLIRTVDEFLTPPSTSQQAQA